MTDFIDSHCPLLNFDFIPDSFIKSRSPIREWLFRFAPTGWLTQIITKLLPGSKYDRLHEMLWLMRQEIKVVGKNFLKE